LKSADESLPRTGYGYDVHRLTSGRKLILGGVEIPSALGLDGHSDADVIVHAVMDALLGAAALGDIGQHFPNTDPRYRGISSLLLLKHVAGLLDSRGFALVNVDATLVLEQPKILAYADRMRANIADALGVPVERISLKATTGEQMGFIGRGEGAAAHAVATIVRR
jgi:2-C-methyl-D-erythritol 2,4-cyclodiphosphate synthase